MVRELDGLVDFLGARECGDGGRDEVIVNTANNLQINAQQNEPARCGLTVSWAAYGYLPCGFPPGRWVSAEAATDLTAGGVLGLLSSLDAVEATRADVRSLGLLVAMTDVFQSSSAGKWWMP